MRSTRLSGGHFQRIEITSPKGVCCPLEKRKMIVHSFGVGYVEVRSTSSTEAILSKVPRVSNHP